MFPLYIIDKYILSIAFKTKCLHIHTQPYKHTYTPKKVHSHPYTPTQTHPHTKNKNLDFLSILKWFILFTLIWKTISGVCYFYKITFKKLLLTSVNTYSYTYIHKFILLFVLNTSTTFLSYMSRLIWMAKISFFYIFQYLELILFCSWMMDNFFN
jgi:hypothetical protein